MNDILKYWLINIVRSRQRMSVPMGEIVNIKAVDEGTAKGCVLTVRDARGTDTWTTYETTYDDVMKQWSDALKRFAPEPNQKWEVT